jgi:hypothetical protein
MTTAIFWPLIAQAGLTIVVTWRMYQRRVAEIRGRRIHPQTLTTRAATGAALEDTRAADNFQNLFEAPVLFYVVCVAVAITGTESLLQIGLAWLYVLLRSIHSYIHLTYNRVMHRFAAFAASGAVLVSMWVAFAYSLAVASR